VGELSGVVSVHSLVIANYVSRANAVIIDLRELLKRGWSCHEPTPPEIGGVGHDTGAWRW